MPDIYAIVLAGGSGTRLWPLSGPSRPKHLLPLLGGEGSLLQRTVQRVLTVVEPTRLVTVTQKAQEQETLKQLGIVSPMSETMVLVEPMGRNTLPAIAWAVLRIAQRCPDALVSVFPSDHLIANVPAFQAAWHIALKAARQGFLTTFGIRPTAPETGYGYIRVGASLDDAPGAYRAGSFVEKPDLGRAKEYLASGDYFWNSGIFVFPAALFLEELKAHQPEIETALRQALAAGDPAGIDRAYDRIPSLSIDCGLLEKSRRVAVVPVDFGWNDLGSWEALYQVMEKDKNQNVIEGDVLPLGTQSSLLISKKGLLAAIGLKDMVVVQTDDAVLVSPRDRVQEVKQIVERLKDRKPGPVETHTTVARPWGTYTVLEEGPGYKIKKIVVEPGQKLSLQWHDRRAEHWVVIEGTAKVTCGDKVLEMRPNESTFIPQGERHRLENPGNVPLIIIEVQTGSYVGEDDITRIDDIYGRTVSR